MALKDVFRKYQPVQIYIVLVLTVFYFAIQMAVSHITHALTLLVDAYHVLCNLIALYGCILSFKYQDSADVVTSTVMLTLNGSDASTTGSVEKSKCSPRENRETRLRNTFGWARIDVLVMLIGCIFLCSLCFSLLLEAAQTLSHISHHDAMHHPLEVLLVGALGLILNGFCYLMIGGYTYYQGGFLRVADSGDITLEKGISDIVDTTHPAHKGQFKPRRQGPWEMTRDVLGCVFVMISSTIVYLTDEKVAKFVDPALAIISAILLLTLSYPSMREAGYILLQTIPNHIDIDSLCSELVEAFPNILNVHEIHVWQLDSSKTVSTAHIIFLNSEDYMRCTDRLIEFFYQQGISHVTIQPEFYEAGNDMDLISSKFESTQCLIRCLSEDCNARNCCSVTSDTLTSIKIPDEEVKSIQEGSESKPIEYSALTKHRCTRHVTHQRSLQSMMHMRNSTPILHLLKTAHGKKTPRIQKARCVASPYTKSCVQLQMKYYDESASHCLKRSLSADHVN